MSNLFAELLRDATDILKVRSKQVYDDLRVIGKDASPLTEGRLQGEEAALDFCLAILESDYPDELYDRYPTFMKAVEDAREEEGAPEPPTRFVELHPPYPGAVWTEWMRGAGVALTDEGDGTTGQESVSSTMHNYYESISSDHFLLSRIVALKWTIPDDFKEWAERNAILVRYRTESGTYLNSHVEIDIYKSGKDSDICGTAHLANTEWSAIIFSECVLDSWQPGDVLEIYLHLASRNDYFARVGSIRFNYIADVC